MPRTTQQMRVLSPVLTDAPGSRQINGIDGVRDDGTFVRDDESVWTDARDLAAADKWIDKQLAERRKNGGTKPLKDAQLPLSLRLAQKAHDAVVAETSAKDAFEPQQGVEQKEERMSRRTTTTFGEALEEPKGGLFKRLLRRGNQQGNHKK